MKASEAKQAFDAGNTSFNEHHIRVRTRSGAEYDVARDVIECGTDDWREDDGYVYGERANGRVHMRGRRRVDTRDQTRWFCLKNVTLVTKSQNA